MTKKLGAVYTPEAYAQILTNWALQSKTSTVLDLGIGMGVFAYQALERLKELGADEPSALKQIYGAEIDKNTFAKFSSESKTNGLNFNNLQNIDFFDYKYPKVQAIIGNPPYVRRRQLDRVTVRTIKEKTIQQNTIIDQEELYALSDLYVYFLLAALPNLEPGGRFAAIVADTWLNARYGNVLKKYLVSEFQLCHLISLDRRVFVGAQVKAVIILAIKKSNNQEVVHPTRFSRIRNGLSINDLSSYVQCNLTENTKEIKAKDIDVTTLEINSPWGAIFKSSTIIDEILNKPITVSINKVARIGIGLQTLAKDFFVVTREQKEEGVVEGQYLVPYAYSISSINKPIIREKDILNYVFCCSSPKENLLNTKALEHILEGEKREINVRGKGISIIGYQNKERIIEANRPYWYDVKTEIDKKERAEILLPRFVFQDYFVIWNKANSVPGGALIQFFPHQHKIIDIRVSLAILTSTFSESIFRINSQIYGGGTSNLRINDLKKAPTIDIFQLSTRQQTKLVKAYDEYVKTGDKNRIDEVVNGILGLDEEQVVRLRNLLVDLKSMVISARKVVHPQ